MRASIIVFARVTNNDYNENPPTFKEPIMLDHLANYALLYLLLATALIVGPCIWSDVRNGYVSNPFKS